MSLQLVKLVQTVFSEKVVNEQTSLAAEHLLVLAKSAVRAGLATVKARRRFTRSVTAGDRPS
jgi:hypothetical protein